MKELKHFQLDDFQFEQDANGKIKPAHVHQIFGHDCGHAAVAIILQSLGFKVDLDDVKSLMDDDNDPLSMLDIIYILDHFGVKTYPIRRSETELKEIPLPFIALDQNPQTGASASVAHFLVILKKKDDFVLVSNPSGGLYWGKFDEILKNANDVILAVNKPKFDTAQTASTKKKIFNFNEIFKTYAPRYRVLTLLGVLSGIFALFPGFILGKIVDNFSKPELNMYLVAFLLSNCALVVLSYFSKKKSYYISWPIQSELYLKVFDYMFKKSYVSISTKNQGDILATYRGVATVEDTIKEISSNWIVDGVEFLCYSIALILLSPLMAIIILIAVIGTYLLNYQSVKAADKDLYPASLAGSAESVAILQNIESYKIIRRSLNPKHFTDFWKNSFDKLASLQINYNVRQDKWSVAHQFLFLLMRVGLIVVVVYMNKNIASELSVGNLITSLFYLSSIFQPLINFSNYNVTRKSAFVAVSRLNALINNQKLDVDNKKLLQNFESIKFENVSFQYGTPSKPVTLKNISFEIQSGDFVVICGKSGSGKSTTLGIIEGAIRPQEGKVLINGQDINQVDTRAIFAIADQQPQIITGTVWQNIALGENSYEVEKLERAIQIAKLTPLIEKLPGGINSHISSAGTNLSGGEKQRICIARAIYSKAPVIMMDEPTSALDETTAIDILKTIQNTIDDKRTLIIVTHNPKLITLGSTIIELQNGNLVNITKREKIE